MLLIEQFFQILTLDIVHDDVGLSRHLSHIVNLYDIGMFEFKDDACFSLETGQTFLADFTW